MKPDKLTPEQMLDLFSKIVALHKTFKHNNNTVAGWIAAMNKMGASYDEIKEAIIDHSLTLNGRYEPKVSDIAHHIRKNRGLL